MKIILLFLTILLLLISCKSKSNPASPAQKSINLISTIVFDNGEIKDIDLY